MVVNVDPSGSVAGCSLGTVNPVLGLFVLGVINLLWRVDGRVEVLQDAARLLGLPVDEQLIAAALHTCIKTGLAMTHHSDAGTAENTPWMVLFALCSHCVPTHHCCGQSELESIAECGQGPGEWEVLLCFNMYESRGERS